MAQYHVWLAVDTKGLLVLVPGFPLVNALVCTLVFMVISRTLSDAFGLLTAKVLPKDLPSSSVLARAAGFTVLLYCLSAMAKK